ncbi:MFS transporter [Chromobacterium sp. IIBBL 290-4]|uniref:MFS transporter n=1 Tax=Chromobacterium sp. IIBBL 290-4 TaxID=2953890 RepID=UPI0020B83393|nr:MFS transporter [Chromobacterium sp. IIBBL 290-4]UTH75067.1 MFS transporter [Chromobacterium sp. IIBBL 290-4]
MKVELGRWLDERPLGGFQIRLSLMCGLCAILDGFDLQAMAYAAPSLRQLWHLESEALGPMLSAGLLGLLLGALLSGALSDRIGRRPVLLCSTLLFAGGMLCCARADSLWQLLGWRLATGLGLGGVLPNAVALVGEYSPARRRASLTMLISGCFTVGGLLGGLLSAWLIPAYGWRWVFCVGGVLPLLLWAWMLRELPESAKWLLLRGRAEAAAHWLRRMEPKLPADVEWAQEERPEPRGAVRALFQNGRARRTIMLWLLSFINLIVLYFLTSWMPLLLHTQGLSLHYALLASSMLQLGGVAGTFELGYWMDRRGFEGILTVCFLGAALSFWQLGMIEDQAPWLFVVLFCAGYFIIGAQPALNTLAAGAYPTNLRATGVGWSLGIGRIGSVLGPSLGGAAIGAGWNAAALSCALVSLAVLLAALAWAYRQAGEQTGA